MHACVYILRLTVSSNQKHPSGEPLWGRQRVKSVLKQYPVTSSTLGQQFFHSLYDVHLSVSGREWIHARSKCLGARTGVTTLSGLSISYAYDVLRIYSIRRYTPHVHACTQGKSDQMVRTMTGSGRPKLRAKGRLEKGALRYPRITPVQQDAKAYGTHERVPLRPLHTRDHRIGACIGVCIGACIGVCIGYESGVNRGTDQVIALSVEVGEEDLGAHQHKKS